MLRPARRIMYFNTILESFFALEQIQQTSIREVILEQYGGTESISKRQWSGIMSHLEVMEQDRKNGGEVVR